MNAYQHSNLRLLQNKVTKIKSDLITSIKKDSPKNNKNNKKDPTKNITNYISESEEAGNNMEEVELVKIHKKLHTVEKQMSTVSDVKKSNILAILNSDFIKARFNKHINTLPHCIIVSCGNLLSAIRSSDLLSAVKKKFR